MNGLSLFSSAGIGEMYLKNTGVDIVVANELLKSRADCYTHLYPNTTMIQGDIQEKSIKAQIKAHISKEVTFLLATPPCQGVSSLGKNKVQSHFELDSRNFLIFDVFEIIDYGNFNYILIENTDQ